MVLSLKRKFAIGVFAPFLYLLAMYAIFRGVLPNPETMSVTYLFCVPAITSILVVIFDQKPYGGYLKLYSAATFISLLHVVIGIGFILFNVEALVCVIMASPILLAGMSIGLLLAYLMRKLWLMGQPPTAHLSIAFLPLLLIPIEQQFPAPDEIRKVQSEIIIHASAADIWDEIIAMENIKESEVPWSFSHNIMGIPKPKNASLNREGVGAVRSVKWDKGVYFDEIITQWQPNEKIAYDWQFYADSFPRGTWDEYLEIGGKYLDIVKGSYRFEPMGENKTRIILSTTYRSTTRFNYYTRLWANFLIDDFHQAILTIAKNRLETHKNNSKLI